METRQNRRFVMVFFVSALFSFPAWAGEPGKLTPLSEIEKARKRLYPGGRDEEDLKVLAMLPEALKKTDDKTLQKEVYKTLYNQDLKNDTAESGGEPETGH